MRQHLFYIKSTILAFALVILAGCSNFLDINDDPNNPVSAPLSQILPYTQATMAGALGLGTAGLSDVLSVWSHHFVQRSNHDDYATDGDDFNITQPWDKLYAVALTDLREIIRIGTEQESWHYVGVAQVMRAYAFSSMVDVWGDIPYFQANEGSANPFPPFDDGKAIYTDLFALLDEAIANLNKTSARPLGNDDLIYNGNVSRWIKAANTIKLNMYNKVRLTDLYNSADVGKLLTDPLMSGGGDDFQLTYSTSIAPENRHPAFVREYARSSPAWYISPYFYQLMQGNTACQNPIFHNLPDPRVPYYFYNQLAPGEAAQNPVAYRDGEFLSIWFGSLNRDPNEGFDQAISQTVAGLYPIGGQYDDGSGTNANANMGLRGASAQRLLTYASSLFVRAELALTKGTGENARDLFASAMNASFSKLAGLASAAGAPALSASAQSDYTDGVLALYDAGDDTQKLELILTEKWISEFGYGLETYNDIRRTGFPKVFLPNEDNNQFTAQTRLYPVSLPYNTGDLQINPNAPPQRDKGMDRVFWDVN